jgi:hypothetical protein
VGDFDDEVVVLILKRGADGWPPYSVIRFDVVGQRGAQLRAHCS